MATEMVPKWTANSTTYDGGAGVFVDYRRMQNEYSGIFGTKIVVFFLFNNISTLFFSFANFTFSFHIFA